MGVLAYGTARQRQARILIFHFVQFNSIHSFFAIDWLFIPTNQSSARDYFFIFIFWKGALEAFSLAPMFACSVQPGRSAYVAFML